MPDLNWNQSTWGATYDWDKSGEEWSEAWGGSAAQWFGSIFPRLHRFLPARRILEIAPGFGRWTKFLVPACDEFVGIDLSEKCVEACRQRFSGNKHAQFYANDGQSLAAAQDSNFDLIFSFDSLVHAEFDILAAYVPQILKKLAPGGVAFIHHSNLMSYNQTIGIPHGRASSVSADVVAELIRRADGAVLVQEIANWGGDHMIDCMSLFAHRGAYPAAKPVRLQNPMFMAESTLIQHFQSPYSKLVLDGPGAA